MDTEPIIKELSSPYILIKWNRECWVQIPHGLSHDEDIPDKYIFHPEWNRGTVNNWWNRRGIETLGRLSDGKAHEWTP